jgi:hypothetical protein
VLSWTPLSRRADELKDSAEAVPSFVDLLHLPGLAWNHLPMHQHNWILIAQLSAVLTVGLLGNWFFRRQNRRLQLLRQRAETGEQSSQPLDAPGEFVVTPAPRVGPKGMAKLGWGILAAFPAWMAIPIAIGASAGVAMVFFFTFGIGMYVVVYSFYFWSKHGNTCICVTSEGLTANRRKGDVYSVVDASLGSWVPNKVRRERAGAVTLGTALHLRCGPKTLVLGGRDHRLGAGVRLQAPPTERLDAWMWADDFDRLLVMFGRRSRLDVRGPAPGEPIRCLLFTNPWLLTRRQRARDTQPVLALDVGSDQIRVIDPNANATVASAFLAQVTATPADNVVRMSGSWKVNYVEPVLVVRVPGMAPLTIGCRDEADPMGTWVWGTRQFPRRFSWSDSVPSERATDFVVSGADWRTLVEKFGLASHMDDSAELARLYLADKASRARARARG